LSSALRQRGSLCLRSPLTLSGSSPRRARTRATPSSPVPLAPAAPSVERSPFVPVPGHETTGAIARPGGTQRRPTRRELSGGPDALAGGPGCPGAAGASGARGGDGYARSGEAHRRVQGTRLLASGRPGAGGPAARSESCRLRLGCTRCRDLPHLQRAVVELFDSWRGSDNVRKDVHRRLTQPGATRRGKGPLLEVRA
jgi:hypothetical protein